VNPSGSQPNPGLQIPLRDERQQNSGIRILIFPLQSVDDALFGSGVQHDLKSKFVKDTFQMEFELTLPIFLLVLTDNNKHCYTYVTVNSQKYTHLSCISLEISI